MNKGLGQLPFKQIFIGVGIGFLTLLTWLVTIQTMTGLMPMGEMVMTPSWMDGSGFAFISFLLMWLVMMVAMMLPSAAPMILSFDHVAKQQESRDQALIPTGVFVAGYVAAWTLFGVISYIIILVVQTTSEFIDLQSVKGIAILLAGLYQFSPLKTACLRHLQAPIDFIEYSWREGIGGAFELGMHYGRHCVICCWGLMVVLFILGLMNLVVMSVLTVVILVEKSTRGGVFISRLVGAGLIVFGFWSAVSPDLAMF